MIKKTSARFMTLVFLLGGLAFQSPVSATVLKAGQSRVIKVEVTETGNDSRSKSLLTKTDFPPMAMTLTHEGGEPVKPLWARILTVGKGGQYDPGTS